MGLEFLVPAFLLGLAAIAVPVILHLTRRQRSRVVEFPSLMFLDRIPYRSLRRRKIRHWLLLLARAGALALLVAAFARPLFTDPDLAAGTVLGPREVVILLDRSYSMAYDDRWERAGATAREVIQGLSSVDRASLIFFDDGAQAVLRSTSELDRLLRAVDSAGVGSKVTRFGPALKLTESILEDSDLPNREVVLITDFQRSGWTGDEDVRLPLGTRVLPFPVQDQETANVTVSDLTLKRQLFSGRERVAVSARVARSGGEEGEVPVLLEIDGQEVATQRVRLGPGASGGVAFDPVTLTDPFTRGVVRAMAEDALAPDDARHFVISPGRATSVLLVESPGTSETSSLYLKKALEISDEVPYQLDVRTPGVLGADLSTRSVIVLNDVPIPGGDMGERLRSFVSAGGGLWVILGERSRLPRAAPDLLPATFSTPVDRLDAGRLGYLDFSHPVFELFSGADGGDFSRARFYRYRPLTLAPDATVLARFDDGALALAERRIGKGRVLLWASSADNFWNDLVLQPVFLPLVHQTVNWLSGHARSPEWFTTGDVLDLSDPEAMGFRGGGARPTGARTDDERVALHPSGGSTDVPAGASPAYLQMDEHGFYQVRTPGSDEERPYTVAVNVDVAESDLTSMDPEELVIAVSAPSLADEGQGITGQGGIFGAEDLERRQGLWRYLLMGAFLLLVVETAVSNRVSLGQGRTVP